MPLVVKSHQVSLLLGWLLVACGERADAESPRPAAAASPVAPETAVAPAVRATPPGVASSEASEHRTEPRIVLAAGGDVNLGRECGQEILKSLDYDPFSGLGSAWKSADARFVNLESQLSDQKGLTQSRGNRLIFTGPPGGADVLARTRISLISTANNHAWDYGKEALLETIANLERAGVPFAGTGRDVDQAYRPAVIRVRGRSLALFAVTQIWNQGAFHDHEGKNHVAWANTDRLKAGIEQAKREHDFVLVSYHGGEEYIDAPVDKTRAFVKSVMALGVDAFIGHHPHVPQGVGWVNERPVLYSLGNFVFAGHDNRPWTKQSFFARLVLEKGKPSELWACPYAIEGHRPRTLEEDPRALDSFRAHLELTSTSVGGSAVEGPTELGCWRVKPSNASKRGATRPRDLLPTGPKSPKTAPD